MMGIEPRLALLCKENTLPTGVPEALYFIVHLFNKVILNYAFTVAEQGVTVTDIFKQNSSAEFWEYEMDELWNYTFSSTLEMKLELSYYTCLAESLVFRILHLPSCFFFVWGCGEEGK